MKIRVVIGCRRTHESPSHVALSPLVHHHSLQSGALLVVMCHFCTVPQLRFIKMLWGPPAIISRHCANASLTYFYRRNRVGHGTMVRAAGDADADNLAAHIVASQRRPGGTRRARQPRLRLCALMIQESTANPDRTTPNLHHLQNLHQICTSQADPAPTRSQKCHSLKWLVARKHTGCMYYNTAIT